MAERKMKKTASGEPLTDEEREHVLEMVQKVATKESKGFVMATITDDEGYASSRFFGNNISKSHVIQVVMKHLDIDEKELVSVAVQLLEQKL